MNIKLTTYRLQPFTWQGDHGEQYAPTRDRTCLPPVLRETEWIDPLDAQRVVDQYKGKIGDVRVAVEAVDHTLEGFKVRPYTPEVDEHTWNRYRVEFRSAGVWAWCDVVCGPNAMRAPELPVHVIGSMAIRLPVETSKEGSRGISHALPAWLPPEDLIADSRVQREIAVARLDDLIGNAEPINQ